MAFTPNMGNCLVFSPLNLESTNLLTIEVPPAESFVVYLTDPNWRSYTHFYEPSMTGHNIESKADERGNYYMYNLEFREMKWTDVGNICTDYGEERTNFAQGW